MASDSRVLGERKAALEDLMRERMRATIEAIVEEELEAALGAARSQRVGAARAGYRHGTRERQLTSSLGAPTIAMPRARIEDHEGPRREWRSRMIARYQRRTERVDEAILGVYLVTLGVCANGQRVALDPRLAGAESAQAWLDAVRALCARNLGAPPLAVIAGNPGLAAALKPQWPQLAIQRRTNHKLWNLLAKAPAHPREALAEDYRRMIYADRRQAVAQARSRSRASGSCARRRSVQASPRPATNSSPLPVSRVRSGRRCAPPMRWSESTRSFAAAPKPKPRCRARRPSCSRSLGYCAAARSRCAAWSAGRPWPLATRKRRPHSDWIINRSRVES